MLNSLISDSLSRIRNGYMGKKTNIEVLHSKFVESVLKVLKAEGYIGEYTIIEKQTPKKGAICKYISVNLTYIKDSASVKNLSIVSKPSCRKYITTSKLLNFYNKYAHSGLGTVILSTNAGILSGDQALERNIGGEILCVVF